MRPSWFERKGLFVLPVSIPGWLTLLAWVAYLVVAFVQIDAMSHSASDTLMNFAFRAIVSGVIFFAIAMLTSRRRTQ